MRTDVAGWMTSFLQSSDSFYPTGSYAHSFGLEGLVLDGVVRDPVTLRSFLMDQVLPSLACTDLPLAVAAWKAAGDPPDWSKLREICELAAAVRGAREPREACVAIGRQRIELAARLRGGFAAECHRRAVAGEWPTPSCVAFAIEGRSLGAPLEAVLAAILYSAVSGFVAASIKLLRLGQNSSQALLTEALASGAGAIAGAMTLPEEAIGTFNPWWDVASSRHETADFRLFIS